MGQRGGRLWSVLESVRLMIRANNKWTVNYTSLMLSVLFGLIILCYFKITCQQEAALDLVLCKDTQSFHHDHDHHQWLFGGDELSCGLWCRQSYNNMTWIYTNQLTHRVWPDFKEKPERSYLKTFFGALGWTCLYGTILGSKSSSDSTSLTLEIELGFRAPLSSPSWPKVTSSPFLPSR